MAKFTVLPKEKFDEIYKRASDDCVSRQAINDMLENHKVDFSTEKDYRTARACVNAVPPAQPYRIRGRWIYNGVKFPNWEGQIVSEAICSACNEISYFRRAFDKYIGANICPNCGADMTGEQNEH